MKEVQLLQAPNRSYLEFNFCGESATGIGLNQQFVMEADPDLGVFHCREGRVNVRISTARHPIKKYTKPMDEWDMTYSQKVQTGWILTKKEKMEQKIITNNVSGFDGEHYKEIEEYFTRDIVSRLIQAAGKFIEETYTTRLDNVSDEMLALGKEILEDMAKPGLSIAAFNALLKRLYAVIPRRIDNLSANLAKREKDIGEILDNENDIYEVLVTQLKATNSEIARNDKTILEAFGLDWRLATPEEYEMVKNTMDAKNRDKIINIFKVTNLKTQKRFDDFCKENGFTEENGISHLFHGSPMANWWSITTNGLWIRPGLNGGMFGPGLYFAPESDKSIGYTGFGCWRGIGDDHGYLSLNKVATGKPFWFYENDGSCDDMSLLGMKKHKTDCLWAHSSKHDKTGRSHLFRDEVIIYNDAQSTIEYLIEVSK